MTNLLEKFNKAKTAETSKNKKKYTEFDVGDTIIVAYRITEGNNTRVQNFEGIVIAKNKVSILVIVINVLPSFL